MTTLPGVPVRAILRSSLVWDNHACMPLRADADFLPQLERLRDAGIDIVSLNIGFADASWDAHLGILTFMRDWIAERPQTYRLVATIEDIRRCKADGRLGIVFDVEGMGPVVHDPSRVHSLYALGVRWMLIAYNHNNDAGGGCLDDDSGLTDIGRAIIDEMEQAGMVLCLSHAGGRTVADALDHGRNPAIFSHSNPAGDTPHPRNVSDRLMRACAAKGGVIGLSGIGPFLGDGHDPVAGLLRQLCYAIDLVGPDHVGLGLDYVFDRRELDDYVRANPTLFPADFAGGFPMVPPEAMGVIVDGLLQAGLSDAEIAGILGGNWLRIAEQVWR